MNMFAEQITVPANLQVHGSGVPDHAPELEIALAPSYTYDCTLNLSVIGGGLLVVEFRHAKVGIAALEGNKVGEIGGYTGWGTAWFNAPIESLIGQSARVSIELVETRNRTVQVQISRAGIVIGGCTTHGIGIGCGSGAGFATFKASPA